MSPEDAFRRVLAARLPAGPAWAAWIDGTVSELAAVGFVLAPEEVPVALLALRGMEDRASYAEEIEALPIAGDLIERLQAVTS